VIGAERDPALVMKDLAEDLMSHENARDIYRRAIEPRLRRFQLGAKCQQGRRTQRADFLALRSPACFAGCFNEQGNNMARRDTSDPDGVGVYPKWAFSWPLNRRVLYNRASCDLSGKPWDPSRKLIAWDGAKWSGYDVPDIAPTAKPDVVGPFIMNAEGTARLFTRAMMRDGPFPAHYEPFESPIANPVAPKVRGNPAARVFKDDLAQFGEVDKFPYAATSSTIALRLRILPEKPGAWRSRTPSPWSTSRSTSRNSCAKTEPDIIRSPMTRKKCPTSPGRSSGITPIIPANSTAGFDSSSTRGVRPRRARS